MATRLEILKKSLEKKEELFDKKLSEHFSTVRQANGQPLNDKRNGRATMNKWDRKNESLVNLKKSIQSTKDAIEDEESKISHVEKTKENFPPEIIKAIEAGELIIWRKYPNTFFVSGVERARVIWDSKEKKLFHRYAKEIPNQEQHTKFSNAFNTLKHSIINSLS